MRRLRGDAPAFAGQSLTRRRILHLFDQLASQAGVPDFQGCRYLVDQIDS